MAAADPEEIIVVLKEKTGNDTLKNIRQFVNHTLIKSFDIFKHCYSIYLEAKRDDLKTVANSSNPNTQGGNPGPIDMSEEIRRLLEQENEENDETKTPEKMEIEEQEKDKDVSGEIQSRGLPPKKFKTLLKNKITELWDYLLENNDKFGSVYKAVGGIFFRVFMQFEFVNPRKLIPKKSSLLLSQISSLENKIFQKEEKTPRKVSVSRDKMKKRQIQRGFTAKFIDQYSRGDASMIHRLRCNIKLVSHLIQHAISPGFSINFDREFSQISTVMIDFLRVYPKLVKSMNKEADIWHTSHNTVLFLLMELIHMLEVCQKSMEMPKPKSRKNSNLNNEAKKQKKMKE